jgi:large subunit ribosomal protein L7A
MLYERISQAQSRTIIGTKQTLKAMKNNYVSEVFIALDADQQLTMQVASLAKELDIPCHKVDSMKKLGRSCGIEVGATTVAIKSH